MNRNAINAFICPTPPRDEERRHYFTCDECGQAVDARNVEEVFRHLERRHEIVALT